MKKVLYFFDDFLVKKRNVFLNLFLLILIGISFLVGSKVRAYYSFDRNQSVNFATATYKDLLLTTDRSTYGMCNRDATVKLTVNNPNNYDVTYKVSINDSKLTYTIDGSDDIYIYTIPKNGTKTHTIYLKGATTNTSVSIIVTPTEHYNSSSHSKSINLDLTCPVCTWETPSVNKLMKDQTFVYNVTCTDESGIGTSSLSSSAFTVSNSNMISIANVIATKVTNGYKYGLTVKGGSTNGLATISIKAGTVSDNNSNTNSSVTSSNINIDNNVTVNFDQNYNLIYEDTSEWYFYGQSKVDPNNQYNGKTGVAVYSGEEYFPDVGITPAIVIPTWSDSKDNTSYLLSARAKLGTTISNNLSLSIPIYDYNTGIEDFDHKISWNTSNTTTLAWEYLEYKFSTDYDGSFSYILLFYDDANQGPTYVSDIRLREYEITTKQYKAAYGTLPTPTRFGYTFTGWYTDEFDGTKVTDTTTISNTNEHTLYAHWTANTYTINYYTYDGATKLGSSTHTTDSAKGLTTMETLKGTAPNENVSFYGWATAANSTDRDYIDGQSVINLTSTNGETIDLYAIYKSAPVTITYKSGINSATTYTTSTMYYYNAATSVSITTATPSSISYWSSEGWRADTTAGPRTYRKNAVVNFSASTTLYAVYARELTVSYNGNGATSGSTASTTKTIYLNTNSTTTSSQAITLANNGFARTGYTYSKWAAGSTSGTQLAAGASYNPSIAYNVGTFGTTMYAIWAEVHQYTITYDYNYYPDNLFTDTSDPENYNDAQLDNSVTNIVEPSAIDGKAIKIEGGSFAFKRCDITYWQKFSLDEGATYTWEVYVKANEKFLYSGSPFLDVGPWSNSSHIYLGDTNWQRVTGTFTAEATCHNNCYSDIKFSFRIEKCYGNQLYFHSLQFRRVSPTTSSKLTYGTTLGDTVKALSRTGYTFAGWYTDPVGGTEVTSTSLVPEADTTYYAHWHLDA